MNKSNYYGIMHKVDRGLGHIFKYGAITQGTAEVIFCTIAGASIGGLVLGNLSVQDYSISLQESITVMAISGLLFCDGYYSAKKGQRPHDLIWTGIEKFLSPIFGKNIRTLPTSSDLYSWAEKEKQDFLAKSGSGQ